MNWFWNKFFVNKAAAWTALFTGMLTVFTYFLYRVSDTTSETAKISERGFLSLAAAQLGPRLVDNPALGNDAKWLGQEISVIWNNGGNTPARDIVIQTNLQPFYPDLPTSYDYPLNPEKTLAAIGPKAVYGTTVNLPRDMVSDYWHAKKRLFIWGAAVYKDAFPNTPDRLTEFCVELTHLTINMIPTVPKNNGQKTTAKGTIAVIANPSPNPDAPNANLANFQWQQCPTHNCYDEDCKDYAQRVKSARTP